MFIRRGDDNRGQPVLILGLTFDDLATLKEEAILEIPLDGTGYPGKVSIFCAPSDADMLSAMELGVIAGGGDIRREDPPEVEIGDA